MKITTKELNNVLCAIVDSEEEVLSDTQTALDLFMTVKYETGCERLAINKAAISESFFDLRSGLAGEVLQKVVNYQLKFAVIGDFSNYTSKALKDFIYESNKGRSVFFVATEQEALEKLTFSA